MPFFAIALLLSVLVGKILAAQWAWIPAERGVVWASIWVLILGGSHRIAMAYAAVVYEQSRQPALALENARALREILYWVWILTSPFLLVYCGWGSVVDEVLHYFSAQSSLSVALLLWALPSLGYIFLADGALFELDRYLLSQQGWKRDERESSHPGFLAFWWNHFRTMWLMLLIPTALLCGAVDVAHRFEFEQWTWYGRMGFYGLATFGAIALFPKLLAWTWNVRPLKEFSQYEAVQRTWDRLGLGSIPIGQWSTGMRLANAFVLGLLPWHRRLVLSDRLLSKLTQAQLEMILCHEAAHVHRYHAWIRALPFVLSLVVVGVGQGLYHEVAEVQQWVESHAAWVMVLAIAKVLGVFWASGKLAQWSEKDADAQAVRYASSLGLGLPSSESSDLVSRGEHSPSKSLAEALWAASPPTHRHKATWLYPSIQQRCRLLLSDKSA